MPIIKTPTKSKLLVIVEDGEKCSIHPDHIIYIKEYKDEGEKRVKIAFGAGSYICCRRENAKDILEWAKRDKNE